MTRQILLGFFALIVFSLSACQTTQQISSTRPDNAADTAAITAEESGDYLSAAQQYLALAKKSKQQIQANYYLRAALAFWQAEDSAQAESSLANIDHQLLSKAQQLDAAILEAQISLSAFPSNPERALTVLDPIKINTLSPAQQQKILKLKIQAYGLTKNWLEKANSHIQLATLISSDADREKNQHELWQTLMKMSPQALDLFKPGMPPAIDSGWFELAYIVKTYKTNPDAFVVAIENWQRDYPNHPANPSLYEQDLKAGTQLPQDLNTIAVLLPESGPYKTAAEAIKQGIITAHFIAKSNTKLRFYPITTEPSNVWQQYQQAIADNASIVIGPLDKRSVEILAESDKLTIPVLALNRLSDQSQHDNLFQFGLAPEDDAITVANYAIKKNYQRAVILSPNDDWGMRISNAFKQQWTNNGGIILNQATYDNAKNDFSDTITPLLGLDLSTQRKNVLRQTLGRSLEFEPRRRQDIDFIFLAAKPLKARQLVPQLRFHRSGSVPIIATSQAYSGQQNSQQDIDLNKLIITDIPWIFTESIIDDPVYNAIKNNNPEHFDSLVRLYALGTDAYRLIPQLNTLSRSADAVFSGATGILTIDNIGKVNRKTSWGIFKQGELTALPDTE